MVMLADITALEPNKPPAYIEQKSSEYHDTDLLHLRSHYTGRPIPIFKRNIDRTESQRDSKIEEQSESVRSSESPIIEPPVSQILRRHVAQDILAALGQIQAHAGLPSAAVYAEQIFRSIRQLRDCLPSDPFTEILFAFYDALAAGNAWMEYQPSQYAEVSKILQNLLAFRTISPDRVEKTIMAFEGLGFDTTPYPLSEDVAEE
jgi:hypothetical protein